MNFIGSHYYKLNLILLAIVGLRNFDGRTRFVIWTQMRLATCYILFFSVVFFQLARIFTDPKTDIDVSLKVCSYMFPWILVTVRYCSCHRHIHDIEKIFEHIADDWRSLKSDEEIEIVRQYANNSRIFIIIIAVCMYSTTLLVVAGYVSPTLLDIVIPLNESRPKELFLFMEYFVDGKKYFHYIVAHISVSSFLEVTALLTTESLNIVNVQHVCGILKVTSYRLEHSLDPLFSRESRDNDEVYTRLVEAVNIQRRAYKLVLNLQKFQCGYTELWCAFSAFPDLCLLVLGVSSVSINLFRLFQATRATKKMAELIRCSLFVSIHFFYMFIVNYGGQLIMNHCAEIFEKTYFIPWYQAPLRIQKHLLFISQRSCRNLHMTRIGYLFVPSLEGFHLLVKASLSYFTVMYSSSKE
ncbi:uncharacterized protein LOC143371186 [Andrena cerasifolii]|uniref:uncharacterized protein LOC143371186 n=1 Tax=Andrena cerasifolii TaxID=2819439 RepID=UPI0040377F68